MCQRKIIYNDLQEFICPLAGTACTCPMIKEFKHIHSNSKPNLALKKTKTYALPEYCYDINTTIPLPELPGHHVVFRNCRCAHPSGQCMKLPPLLFPVTEDIVPEYIDDDDEPFNPFDGGMGVRPS